MAKNLLGYALAFFILFTVPVFAQDAIVAPPSEIIEEIENETPEEEILDEIPDDFAIDEPLESSGEPLPLIKKKRKIIDSRFLQNKRLIEHPNAAKGLIKIDKKRTYIYKVPTSEQSYAASVRVGLYTPEDLSNPDNSSQNFDDLYSEDDFPMIQYDYEKLLWRSAIGKMGWKAGLGFYIAQGNGQFETPNAAGSPREKFTLLVFPASLGIVHRFQFWDNQTLVPFAGGGADLFMFAERRDDDLNPDIGARLGAAPAVHFNVGGTLRLGRGARAFVDLDREYGINAIHLLVEYKNYIALSDTFDFSSEFIGGGILVEY